MNSRTQRSVRSFGTNALTQTTLGTSRDDSGSFLGTDQKLEIVKKNPFATVEPTGVGKLMQIASELGRQTRPDIKRGQYAQRVSRFRSWRLPDQCSRL